MNMKKLGTSGVQVSEMILGCWVMGGAQWGGADDNESIRAIHAAYDAGINTLDTAEAYNDGYSESIIGKAIQGTSKRLCNFFKSIKLPFQIRPAESGL